MPVFGRRSANPMRPKITAIFAVFMGVVLSTAWGSDITGTWKGSTDMMGRSVDLRFTFKADGSELSGTHTTPQGREFPISEGRINGNDISFVVNVTGRMEMKIRFKGKIADEEIKLTLQMGGGDSDGGTGGRYELTIKRMKVTAALPAADNRAAADAAFYELINRDFASLAKRFSSEMSATMPAEKLPAAVGPLLRSLGALRSDRPEPQVTEKQGYDVFLYPAEFAKAKMTVVISINPAGQVGGLFLTPSMPKPIQPGELVVTSGTIQLPATLVVPEGEGPFPAVVLVHGSGPNDRDETVGANAPFRDLAEGLARHGIASLRYEKRTRQSPLSPILTVKEEVIDDVLNAIALARSQPNIDARRVFLLGHSLGAYLAPRIAGADATIAGIVMLAGNVRPIQELARDQLQYLNAPPERLQQLKNAAPASYWEDLKAYDPIATARQLEIPMFILQGERDYQVTMKEFELWKEGLKGKNSVAFKSYPGLNHLFLEGEGKSLPVEYQIPGRIPDYVYDDIAAFVNSVL